MQSVWAFPVFEALERFQIFMTWFTSEITGINKSSHLPSTELCFIFFDINSVRPLFEWQAMTLIFPAMTREKPGPIDGSNLTLPD